MDTIYMDSFLDGGILRETSFREMVNATDWSAYAGKRVLIKGCSEVPVPTWAYILVATRLAQVADHILFGEPCATVKIFNREEDAPLKALS